MKEENPGGGKCLKTENKQARLTCFLPKNAMNLDRIPAANPTRQIRLQL